jgi:hypothetical protein
MKLLGDMDLYKAIILASFVLLPAAGGWVYWLDGQIGQTRLAMDRAKDQVKEIGVLQKQMETVVANDKAGGVSEQNPNEYFESKIIGSVAGGGIGKDDFTFEPGLRESQVQIGKGKAVDNEVGIIFGKQGAGRTDFKVSREYLFALIYNVEQQQIWKLRHLQITNGTNTPELTAHKTPPAELEDKWIVNSLRFVKRKPADRK